jgi:hypothetical protein
MGWRRRNNRQYPVKMGQLCRSIWVVCKAYLSFQKGEQAAPNQGCSICTDTKMMRRVAAGRNISKPDELTKGIIIETISCQEV